MLRLRPFKNSDAEFIVKWITDEKQFYMWSAGRFGEFPLDAKRLCEHYEKSGDNFFTFTAFDENGVAGHLIIRFLDDKKEEARLGFIIVDSKIRGKGYGHKMIELAIKYCFEILMVSKVSLGVFDNNPNAYNCYKACGLKETGGSWQIKLMGEDWNCIEMAIEKDEYI